MKRSIILFLGICCCCWLQAQEVATINCRIGERVGKEIFLFRVENGRKVVMASAMYHGNGYYGFRFIPEYEGFYVIGDKQNYQYPVYIKSGDAVSVYMDADTVYLTGRRNSSENRLLYKWVALSRTVEAKAIRTGRVRSTYKDFFPDFEKFLSAADRFKPEIKTKNARFDELLQRSVEYEKDLYAIMYLYSARSEHPTREERPVYYATIINPDKFRDDVVLQMPYGMDLLKRYTLFVSLEKGLSNRWQKVLDEIPDVHLKGELIVDRAGFLKSYFEYEKMLSQHASYLNADQKQRLEDVGSRLYEARRNQPSANFTYPNANGKQVSLSDFKGKVVVVDVWATWCGPCRKELPHLRILEEEMKGEEVIFIGVSLDAEKDFEKWKKFIVDEGLHGVQLFAGAGSRISKDYKITGIPRFMVFDKKGNIVEANAPRPSDPNLKALLKEELKR